MSKKKEKIYRKTIQKKSELMKECLLVFWNFFDLLEDDWRERLEWFFYQGYFQLQKHWKRIFVRLFKDFPLVFLSLLHASKGSVFHIDQREAGFDITNSENLECLKKIPGKSISFFFVFLKFYVRFFLYSNFMCDERDGKEILRSEFLKENDFGFFWETFFFENFFSKTFFLFFLGKYFEKKNFFFRLLFRKRREHKTWKNFFLTFFLKKSNHLTKNFIQILKGSFEWHSDFFYLISLALSNSSGESLEFRKRWCSRVSPWQ